METYRNRLLSDYTRDELEELFIRKCEILDFKAREINELEQKTADLSGKLTRLRNDITDQTKQRVKFDGKMAPTAFKLSQATVKELQNEIDRLNIELGKAERARDKVLRDVIHFRNLKNFPGQSHTGLKKPAKAAKSVDDLVEMLAELSSKQTDPLVICRLQAASSLLKNNLLKAEDPMRKIMDMIGESYLPIFESIDKRREIKEREEKIDDLKRKLAELKMQQDTMAEEHSNRLKKYQDEAERNQQKYRDIMDLHLKKEELEADAAKLGELRIIEDGLKNEVHLLLEQKKNLEEDNDIREKKMNDELQLGINHLKSEIEALKAHIEALKKSNNEIEQQTNQLSNQYRMSVQQRGEIADGLRKLEEEHHMIRKKFVHLMSGTSEDPFSNPRFLEFLRQMDERQIPYDAIRRYCADNEKINQKLGMLTGKIDKYENQRAQLKQSIEDKKKIISELKDELDSLFGDNKGNKDGLSPQHRNIHFNEGAPHIHFSVDDMIELQTGFTAIILSFQDLQMDQSVIGTQKCKIFLSVDFLDYQTVQTSTVDPRSTSFDSQILFKVNNNLELKEYIKSKSVEITLSKAVGTIYSELGHGSLSLSPFLQGTNSFTSSLTIASPDGKVICNVKFEANIFIPLVQD